QAGNLTETEIVVGRSVEGDLAAVDQQHQTRSRDRLGDGGQREHGVFCGWNHLLAVGPAEAFLEDDLAVLGNGDTNRGDAVLDEEFVGGVSHWLPAIGPGRRLSAEQGRGESKE